MLERDVVYGSERVVSDINVTNRVLVCHITQSDDKRSAQNP